MVVGPASISPQSGFGGLSRRLGRFASKHAEPPTRPPFGGGGMAMCQLQSPFASARQMVSFKAAQCASSSSEAPALRAPATTWLSHQPGRNASRTYTLAAGIAASHQLAQT